MMDEAEFMEILAEEDARKEVEEQILAESPAMKLRAREIVNIDDIIDEVVRCDEIAANLRHTPTAASPSPCPRLDQHQPSYLSSIMSDAGLDQLSEGNGRARSLACYQHTTQERQQVTPPQLAPASDACGALLWYAASGRPPRLPSPAAPCARGPTR